MINRKDILSLPFYKAKPFHGSDQNMRYRIEKQEITEANEEGEEVVTGKELLITTWPGPYSFEATEDSLKTKHTVAFSDEGLDAAVVYLNQKYADYN